MKITMIGTGYVGLVTGTCFAESGNEVTCLDVDRRKVDMLNRGEIPIYEPGLAELVHRNKKSDRLKFTTNYAEAIPDAQCVFICVGTPQDDAGAADLKYVQSCCAEMAPLLRDRAIVIVKSTVPVGTNRRVAEWIRSGTSKDIFFASNPEFLKEGTAIDDFTKPDRVVVGVDDEYAAKTVESLYKPFLRTEKPYLVVGIESAEMIKYVANCLLATKISFINEMANLCELVGADINDVRRGIGHDQRIGFSFLFSGVGYGGSCFPKDVRALAAVAESHGMEAKILRTVDSINDRQKTLLFEKISRYFNGDLKGRTIAIWGLAFKPRTDDVREAPSLVLIRQLLDAGASVAAHDPVAQENVRMQEGIGDRIKFCDHHYDVCNGADALAIVTEWNEFRSPDFDYIGKKLKHKVIFDGRNLYNPLRMAEAGFYYSGVGLAPRIDM